MAQAKKTGLGRLCKERMIDEMLERFKESPSFVVTSYAGSSVSDLELLRRNLKKSSGEYLVVKNSMLKIIFEKLKLASEMDRVESGMGIGFSGGDIVSTCNALVTFAKAHNKFKIKSAVIDGKSVTTDRVNMLAGLPPRQILLAHVVGTIKAPVTGFVNCLGAVLRKFVYCIDAIKTSRESSAPQGAAEQAKT